MWVDGDIKNDETIRGHIESWLLTQTIWNSGDGKSSWVDIMNGCTLLVMSIEVEAVHWRKNLSHQGCNSNAFYNLSYLPIC